jgi:signal peptidase I
MDNYYTEQYTDAELQRSERSSGGLKRFIIELLETLIIAAILFTGINAVSSRIRVKSISMQPTLYEKDFVLVNKLSYEFGEPERGDVIVFEYPLNPDVEPYIKRVIGLPGDSVEIKGGMVIVNGEPLREPYTKAPPNYTGAWSVPQDSLFVLGDNRNYSSDSHQWGMVPIENVMGKALFVYYPLEHLQILNPETAAAAGPR